jgi:hypothetical protein
MDMLRWVVIGGAALAIALVAAMRLAWENAGSQTLVLATAALVGASGLFVVQTWFELQKSSTHDQVGMQYTINHETASIGQFSYADVIRARSEINASNWLKSTNASAFDDASERVASDFALFSLTYWLASQEFDWQLQRMEFSGEVVPAFTIIQPVSPDDEGTVLKEADLKSRLSAAENIFAGAQLSVGGGRLRLPPHSTLQVTEHSLVIENPVCRVAWELQRHAAIYMDPRTNTVSPRLPSGKQKLETRIESFKMDVTYFALRSHRRDIDKYRDWTSRLFLECHKWFDGRGTVSYSDNGVPQ